MRNEKQKITHKVRRRATLTTGWWRRFGILWLQFCLFWAATAMALPAQNEQDSNKAVTFTTLVNFDGTNGSFPLGSPVQGTNGNLYGTTSFGGPNLAGNVFNMTPSGTLTVLHNFCGETNCADGNLPGSGLALGTDRNFYGTTLVGGTPSAACPLGAEGCGTVFKITSTGALSTLYNFCSQPNCTDGWSPLVPPSATLIQAADGNFYGINNTGGANIGGCAGLGGCGTIFKITPQGALTTLYTFCSQTNCTDGGTPVAALLQATDGNFYGTTISFGANGGGTVFTITPEGRLTTLYSFCSQANCADGSGPLVPLVQATDGNFYGVAFLGGLKPCALGGCGTVFKITPAGVLTTLHSFDGADGALPAGLAQATNGTFYGTAYTGGRSTIPHAFPSVAARSSACPSGWAPLSKPSRLAAGLEKPSRFSGTT